MLPARLTDLGTHLDFLEDADYLRFAESGFLHVETPSGGILYFRVVQVFKGTSVSRSSMNLMKRSMATNKTKNKRPNLTRFFRVRLGMSGRSNVQIQRRRKASAGMQG